MTTTTEDVGLAVGAGGRVGTEGVGLAVGGGARVGVGSEPLFAPPRPVCTEGVAVGEGLVPRSAGPITRPTIKATNAAPPNATASLATGGILGGFGLTVTVSRILTRLLSPPGMGSHADSAGIAEGVFAVKHPSEPVA